MSKAEETTTKSGGENEPQNKDDKSDDESEGGNAIVNCLFKWVFPIYMDEILQILPLIFMMFSSLFSYTAYRDIKDAIVWTNIYMFLFMFNNFYLYIFIY